MTEYTPTPEDDELEATIGRLFDRLVRRRARGQRRVQDDREAVGALDGVVDVLDHRACRAPDIPAAGRRMVRASA